MTLREGNHHIRLSLKLWDFFEKRKQDERGSVQAQVNIILATFKEKIEREEEKNQDR